MVDWDAIGVSAEIWDVAILFVQDPLKILEGYISNSVM